MSLTNLIFRFKGRVSLTFLLVMLESLLDVFYPLFIGLAIDGLLQGKYDGVIQLGALGMLSLLVGASRRAYDTRVYAGIYRQVVPEMVEKEQERGSSVSKISARSSLLTEFVEFLENSMPEIIRGIVSLVGILVMIAALNQQVFFACLGILLLIMVVYGISGKTNYRLNASYNNQLEHQVQALESKDIRLVQQHYTRLMQWNIKLSDLENLNYVAIWIGVIALLVYTPITVVEGGTTSYGQVSSIFMYVFNYIEASVTFPLYIQQLIRLKEISRRLADT
jgi:ABC-type multidrug transport system fused ATPase/permease subunit